MLVPWNAAWTAEDHYEIRNCRWVGGKPAVWAPHRPGEGRPIFAKPHMVRQRRSIAEMRCTVCGRKTAPYDRWWFVLGDTTVPGYAFATTEAPVHHGCAVIALRHCPHLRALDVQPAPMPPADVTLSTIVGGLATDRDFGLDLNGRKVVGHLKLAWRRMPAVPRAKVRP